jgi:hypothetical protein
MLQPSFLFHLKILMKRSSLNKFNLEYYSEITGYSKFIYKKETQLKLK